MKDIHDYQGRLDRELEILQASKISEQNKQTIMRFYTDCRLQRLGIPRLQKLVEVTRTLAQQLNKDYDKASVDDIKQLVLWIDQKAWKPWTKVTNKTVLKKLYKWLKGDDTYPAEVRWIKTTIKVQEQKLISPEELITDEETNLAISTAEHPRDKAFLAVLAESGGRIGEIGTLHIKNLTFDNTGVVLTVNGKTGPRRIRIITSAPLLANWLNHHPCRKDPEAPVWINIGAPNYHNAMRYNGFAEIIKRTFQKAGIKKKCNPHLFRHSRASLMANHLTEFQMNHYFGWVQGSDMPSTYVHLTGKDLDTAIYKMNNIPTNEPDTPKNNSKECTRCKTQNPHDASYCTKCATPLDPELVIQEQKKIMENKPPSENLLTELMKNPEFKRIIFEKLLQTT